MSVLAMPDERVTCENGHFICEVAESLVTGGIVAPSAFKNWRPDIEKPVTGQLIPPCPECGAQFIAIPPKHGAVVHIESEWRIA